MNLDQITTKCFILALFIRDDGERLLLGDGYYDFNQKLQHFQANTIANDVVEIQGDNGQLLAGQVMRSGAQKFEGYIGDATTNRQIIEQKRSDFMAFFRIKHFYNVIYIFPDGTAIQRQRGYLTDAPTIPEIFQKFPEYSVALNFEDANYYEYAEDEHGDEIYAHIAELALAGGATGGLVWDAIGAVTNGITWSGIQTAQGEYITITNDLDIPAKLASVEMLGKAEQTTYSGKQLYNYTDLRTTGTFLAVGDDGWYTFTADRTSESSGNYYSFSTYNLALNYSTSYAIVTEIASASITGVANITPADRWGQFETALFYNNPTVGTYVGTRTTKSEWGSTEGLVSNVFVGAGSKATIKFRISVIADTSVTPATFVYEPYVGGTASPNPDYPQPISVVTGENTVKIEGKNLSKSDSIDNPDANYVSGGVGSQPVQYNSTYNGFTTSTNRARKYANLQAGQTYTFSLYAQINPDWAQNIVAYFYRYNPVTDTTGSILGSIVKTAVPSGGGRVSKSITIPEGWEGLYVVFYGATYWNDIQLELSPTATTYEPYQGQEFEVNLGKNLFDLKGFLDSKSATYTEASDGTITFTSVGALYSEPFQFSQDDITVSIQGIISNLTGTNFRIQLINKAGTAVGEISSSTTTRENLSACKVRFNWSDRGTFSLKNIQVERGTQPTSYSAYFTPIELAKIGNYQDRIYKTDGKWYIEKQVRKVALDGARRWIGISSGVFYTDNISDYSRSNNKPLSNNFTGTSNVASAGSVVDGTIAFGASNLGTQNRFYVKNTTIGWTSETVFKQWLTAHPTTVYYALATPTTTEITNEALIAQLDALGASSLYLGVNNIGTETQNAMPTLKIEYYTAYTLDGAGYEWEPGGNTARTIVTVAGVDSAWPIWTIQGGAQNPTLTNITTGQTISWQGFVPEGQTLTINMAEMTADLAGANVFEYITGEWLRLAPGNNTLVYNAGNADKSSTLSWNGVLA